MTVPSQDREKLRMLLALASDGSLSNDQRQDLSTLLADRRDFLPEYLSLVSIDFLLRQEDVVQYLITLVKDGDQAAYYEQSRNWLAEQPAAPELSVESAKRGTVRFSTFTDWINPVALAWTGLAATLLIVGVTLWALLIPVPATIVETQNAVWADLGIRNDGDELGGAWEKLESGSAKISFRSGATIKLAGPTEFRILSSGSCELKKGSLSAYVPEQARGFRVALAGATVVDLGTAFRVDVHPDEKTQVYVTEGQIRIEPRDAGESLSLRAGQLAEWTDAESPRLLPAANLVPKTSKTAQFSKHHPPSLGFGQYKHDDQMFIFLESPEIVLPYELRVDVMSPGRHETFTASEGSIPAGSRVRSYLIHFSPLKQRQILSGSITFPSQILGIICDSDRLNATNDTLGTATLLRCLHPERGMESFPNPNSDSLTISQDRRTLSLRFRTVSIDQIRVITAVVP